ncbi:MAG: hypothetical protein K2P81_09665 [Bacteriovoracaceae bacterium]|nr:hypothetical protein [Bacteriovoracaceae bacterium]
MSKTLIPFLLMLQNPVSPDFTPACNNAPPPLSSTSELANSCYESLCSDIKYDQSVDEVVAGIENEPDLYTDEDKERFRGIFKKGLEMAEKYRAVYMQKTSDQWAQEIVQDSSLLQNFTSSLNGNSFSVFPTGDGSGKWEMMFPPDISSDPVLLKASEQIAVAYRKSFEDSVFVQIANDNISFENAQGRLIKYFTEQKKKNTNGQREAYQEAIDKINQISSLDEFKTYMDEFRPKYPMAASFDYVPMTCSDCKDSFKKILDTQNIAERFDPKILKPKMESFDQIREIQCKSVAWGAKNMAPSREERKRFDQTISEVQKSYQDKIFTKFSSHSREVFNKVIFSEVAQPLKIESDKLTPNFADIESMIGEPVESPSLSDVISLSSTLKNLPNEFFCNDENMTPSDHYDDSELKINFSPYTVKRGEASILAHEFGHWLSFAFKRKMGSQSSLEKFVALRGCVSTLHGSKPVTHDTHPGDTTWTEEDTADVMAAMTSGGGRKAFCAFLNNPLFEALSKIPGLGAMGMSEEQKLSLALNDEDNHSPDLWRVLHSAIYEGREIPAACNQLASSQQVPLPKKCEL